MIATSNACSWACNSWYVKDGNTCKPACKTCEELWYSSTKSTNDCYQEVYPSNACGTCYANVCTKITWWNSNYSCISSSQIPTTYDSDVIAVAGYNGKSYCMMPKPTCWNNYSCRYWTPSSNGNQNWKCTASWKTVDCSLGTCTTSYNRPPCPTGYTALLKYTVGSPYNFSVVECKVGSTLACSVYKCSNSSCAFYESNYYQKDSSKSAGVEISKKC